MRQLMITTIGNTEFISAACSVKGKDKTFNQDAFRIEACTDIIICTLADGLGSAINSEIGAEAVCRIACELIGENGITENFPVILKRRWAESLSYKPISCDTTFKFFVITPQEIIYGGIGDGWVIGIADGAFFEYKASGSFSNQTCSMMSAGYADHFEIFRKPYRTIQGLSLATDGFSEDIDGEAVQPFLRDALRELKEDSNRFVSEIEQNMEDWPVVSNQDDKTIILTGVYK